MVGARSSRGGDGPLGAGALRWTANGEAFGTGGTVTTALALGVLVFATANIAKVKINEVYKEVMPFFWALMGVLVLVTYVPWISLGLNQWLAP